MYRKLWVIQYLGSFSYPEQLVVNGLYLLELVKRKLIVVLFTGSAAPISSSDPTLGVATLFFRLGNFWDETGGLAFFNSIVALVSSMVLFIKAPAIIAQVTLVFNPSKRDSFLSCPHALCK